MDSAKDLVKVWILPYKDKSFQVGGSMNQEDLVSLLLTLAQNLDGFAWSPYNIPEVDLEFITHKLNVDPLFPSKKQNSRRSAKQHIEVVKEEVARLK